MATQLGTDEKNLESTPTGNWSEMADRVLSGGVINEQEALSILQAPDGQLLDILAAAYRVRRTHFGNEVSLYFLMNAKSGLCPEDCSYCSQAKNSDAEIPKYNILNREKLLDGARVAAERGAVTYCIVISSRGPSERELCAIEEVVPEIKKEHDLKICTSLGLLDETQAMRLKACGVDRVNHNLNTGEEHYKEICTTHTYADRVETLQHVRKAGLEMCSGGIVGMGERDEDLVQMAIALRDLEVDTVPINFLIPIEGAAIENASVLSPTYCLKALAMFRLAIPKRELRIAGGRELSLRSLQPLGMYAANAVFVGDYLTTKGQAPEADLAMIRDMGFVVKETQFVEAESCAEENA